MAKINYNITNKLKAELNVNGNVNNRDYSPLNIIDYAYNTNRVIPAYNADGSFFKYPRYNTYNSQYGYYGYNILNEIASSSNKQRSNAVITTAKYVLPAPGFKLTDSWDFGLFLEYSA